MNKSKIIIRLNNQTLHIIVLVLIACAILLPNIGKGNPLHNWDEARHAVNALEVVNSGNWINITYNHEPDFTNIKFPLGAWLIAINYKLFGANEVSVRLWSVMFTILTTVVVYLFGSLIKNKWAGILSAIIFITSTQVVGGHAGTTGDYDAGATFFVALALLLFYLFLNKKSEYLLILSFVAIGLGIMYKSFIPGLIPLLIIFLFILLSKKQKDINFSSIFFWSIIVIITIISPWLAARSISDHHFILELLDTDYLNRLTTAVDDHSAPPWFYLGEMWSEFYPWIYFLIPGLYLLFKNYKKDKTGGQLLLILWFFIVLLIFSIATTKNFWYILPIYPATAIIVGLFGVFIFEKALGLSYGKKILLIVLILFLGLNLFSAIQNIKYTFSNQKTMNNFSSFIEQDSVKKEILSSDLLAFNESFTQSNLFYLERLTKNKVNISTEIPCKLNVNQLWLVSPNPNSLRNFLRNCPERRIVDRYFEGGYYLIK